MRMAGKIRHSDTLPHLRRGGQVGPGLREVVRACVERSQRIGAPRPGGEAVHATRRGLKRARAVLRLGEALNVASVKPVRRRLAKLARELSASRDSTVVTDIVKRLPEKCLDSAAKNMIARIQTKRVSPDQASWACWKKRLHAEIPAIQRLDWGEPTVVDIRRALRSAAKRMRRQAKKVRATGDISQVHAWRKAAIVLRDQLLVVRPLLGGKTEGLIREVRALAQRLGKAMDYNAVVEALRHERGHAEHRLVKLGEKRRQLAIAKACREWLNVRKTLRADWTERVHRKS